MPCSVVVVETFPVSIPYPKLMINTNTNTIILAFSEFKGSITGFVLKSDMYNIGYSSNDWSLNQFRTYNVEVTIRNIL